MVAHMVCTPPMGPPATPSNPSPMLADESTQSPDPNQACGSPGRSLPFP